MLKRKKGNDHTEMASQFIRIGRLLHQGYPLDKALLFIQFHVSNTLRTQISEVLTYLKEGHPVHEAFNVFSIPKPIKSFLYFYEQQGEVADGLIQAGQLLQKKEETKRQLVSLLRYPIVLVWLCGFVLVLMYRFVLPHFQSFFKMVSGTPPLFSTVLFRILDYLPYLIVVLILISICLLSYFYIKFYNRSSYQKVMILHAFPYIGQYVESTITYFFALQLGRLMGAGLSLQQALLQFQEQNYLSFFATECKQIMHELQQGHQFDQLLLNKPYFRKELSFIVSNGEKTGYLAQDLAQYSDILYKQLEEAIQRFMSVVQPVIFLFIGVFIFLLFLATLLPLFQMVGGL